MILPVVAATAHAADGCLGTGPQEIDETIVTLFDVYRMVDEAAFDRTQKNLVAAVSCLTETPTGPQIARLHQAMALTAYVNGQTRAARRSLASARLLDPAWKLDPAVFPPSHPFTDLYAAASDPGPSSELGGIAPEVWVVDGFESEQAPIERSFLLQVRRDGAVVWSGYVYDREEVPDRGQAVARSSLETPHAWWLSVGAAGRTLTSVQRSESAAWADLDESAVGAGGWALGRWTPRSVVGAELGASTLGPVDPVAGGGWQPSGALVAVGGWGSWAGEVQPHGGVRLGASIDRFREWPALAATPTPVVHTVGSVVVGLEGGVRADRLRADLAADVLLAAATTPWQVRGRLDGGLALGGPFAAEGLLELRSGGLRYTDGGQDAGSRRDTDLRFGLALAIWD